MHIQPKEIRKYFDGEKCPWQEWLKSLKDIKTRARVRQRVDRLGLGNLGDCKPVGEGVYELRLDFGPGYGIYFARIDTAVILLLCGGTKKRQRKDIELAKRYLKDYLLED